jgi:hypothetical protein
LSVATKLTEIAVEDRRIQPHHQAGGDHRIQPTVGSMNHVQMVLESYLLARGVFRLEYTRDDSPWLFLRG